MSTHGIAAWIRPIYLYLVSLIAVVTFIIGTVSIAHLLIRTYVFGLTLDYYTSPEVACEYILTQKNVSRASLKLGRPVAAPIDTLEREEVMIETEEEGTSDELTVEEREELFDRCVERQEEQQEEQAKYSFANRMSNGIAMILVAIPVFLFHWRLIRKEKK